MTDHTTPRYPASSGWRETLVTASVVLLLLAVVGIPVLLLRMQPVRNGRRSPCLNNLRNIGIAVYNYHSVYGCFPPAYLADDEGRPMHSWRVLFLPALDHRDLYAAYRFDEPWNGPNNRKLADVMPPVYRCPDLHAPEGRGSHMTGYVALRGTGTVMGGADSSTVDEITDGTGNTLLIVETPGNPVHWMAPRDLPVTRFLREFPSAKDETLPHPGGTNVLFADGSVRFISRQTAPALLKALCTKDGREPLPESW